MICICKNLIYLINIASILIRQHSIFIGYILPDVTGQYPLFMIMPYTSSTGNERFYANNAANQGQLLQVFFLEKNILNTSGSSKLFKVQLN